MARPDLEVADIFRDHGPAWREANRGHVSLDQLKVMGAIERCRTAALGGHVARCENDACGHTTIAYNSCRDRHCPKCQGAAAREWLAEREAELLPVGYFHVVYTLPALLRDIAYQNKRVVYGLLKKASAEATPKACKMSMTMRAAVCVRAGGPDVLEIRDLPVPAVREGWSLVQVKGAGLNRSELRTRQGHSPNVTFSRVLGIECVGIVATSTHPTLPEGTTVAAVMGEMGREFDGGYAEYALLPNSLLMPVTTTLPWDVFAALPESYLTAHGSLDALGVVPGGQGRLLIRGGTSSVGMAAASIASGYGLTTASTTRRRSKIDALTAAGVDYVLVDTGGPLTESVHSVWREGPDYVLDLVGARTAVDSLHLVRRGGTVCVSGSLSGWLIRDFEPIAMIPSGTKLTAFHSDDFKGTAGATVLQRVVREVEAGVYQPNVDRVFGLDDIIAAHRYMEDDQAIGKLVVVP